MMDMVAMTPGGACGCYEGCFRWWMWFDGCFRWYLGTCMHSVASHSSSEYGPLAEEKCIPCSQALCVGVKKKKDKHCLLKSETVVS